jgi:hypothetical protein
MPLPVGDHFSCLQAGLRDSLWGHDVRDAAQVCMCGVLQSIPPATAHHGVTAHASSCSAWGVMYSQGKFPV